MYPGAVAEFIFDQSLAHGAFAEDALNAKNMNDGPGGKKPKMHSTTIPDDNPFPHLWGVQQDMVFSENLPPNHIYYANHGQPKGMKIVLEECGLLAHVVAQNGGKSVLGECANCKMSQWAQDKATREATLASDLSNSFFADTNTDNEDSPASDAIHQSSTCCMRRIISLQKDFVTEKPKLQTIIEEAGHKCYFLPKFHCELNPIEMYWGWVKICMYFYASALFSAVDDSLKVCGHWQMAPSQLANTWFQSCLTHAQWTPFEVSFANHGAISSQKGYNPWKVLYGYKMYISTFQKIKGKEIENERSCQPFILTNANFSLLFLWKPFHTHQSPFIPIKAFYSYQSPFILMLAFSAFYSYI